MNLAAIGTGIFGFLKRIPDWVIWALGVIIFLKFVDMNAERRGREKQRDETRLKQAQTKAAVNERATAIINEERSHADEAIAARDGSSVYPDAASVPDKIGRIIFRD